MTANLSPSASITLVNRLFWALTIAALVALIAHARMDPVVLEQPAVRDYGAAQPLTTPAFWSTERVHGVIWQPAQATTPLTFQSLDGTISAGLVPYGDLEPVRWQIVPAQDDAYHLVWLERDQRLRTALIHADGHTLRGPIELSPQANPDFVLLTQPDNAALVIWTNARTQQIVNVRLDAAGRPGAIGTPQLFQVNHLIAAQDQTYTTYLAWLTPTSAHVWDIHYVPNLDNDLIIPPSTPVSSITLAAAETITSFQLGLTQSHAILILGVTHARQPNHEQLYLVAVPLHVPEISDLQPLSLSSCSSNTQIVPTTTPTIPTVPLRWPKLLAQQQTLLPLIAACYTDEGWRPIMITFEDAASLSVTPITSAPLDAGPPTLVQTPSDGLMVAWTGLADTTPHLYSVEVPIAGTTQTHPPDRTALLLRGLLGGATLGWLWLLLPALLLRIAPPNPWSWPMAQVLFGAWQLLWPGALFHVPPATLTLFGLHRTSNGAALAIVASGVIACSMLLVLQLVASHRRYAPWITWLSFGLTYTVIIWAIFGANLM